MKYDDELFLLLLGCVCDFRRSLAFSIAFLASAQMVGSEVIG